MRAFFFLLSGVVMKSSLKQGGGSGHIRLIVLLLQLYLVKVTFELLQSVTFPFQQMELWSCSL